MAVVRDPVTRARTIAVDCTIKSLIDILSSVVAPAGASKATLAKRCSEIRILHLFSTPKAASGALMGKDLYEYPGTVLVIFDTRLRQIDSKSGAARRAPGARKERPVLTGAWRPARGAFPEQEVHA